MKNWIDANVSSAALARFEQTLKNGGTQLHCIEIFEKDQCVVRWGVKPYDCEDKRELYSLSKSFVSTAVGLAFDRGLVHPDDLLSKFFPQQVAAQTDERWKRVRVRHLMSMSTGHGECPMYRMALSTDAVQAFFDAPLVYEPGSKFIYSTGASCMMGEIVRRACGQSAPDLLAQELFEPLGIENIWWEGCEDGLCQGGTGLKISCDDLAKLGRLYCNKGLWGQKRILSEEWVDMASARQISNEGNGTEDWCAGYGFQFWRNDRMGYRGDGAFGQLCVIVPERQTVVAMMAESLDMSSELNAVWALLEELHSKETGAGLSEQYPLTVAGSAEALDTGWLACDENSMGFTRIRLKTEQDQLRLTLCDGERTQTLRADQKNWTENSLWASGFRPMLYRQMPRTQCTLQRIAACWYQEGEDRVIECRMLNTPHRFLWRLTPDHGGLQIRLVSPLDIFGSASFWTAHPLQNDQK